MMTHTNRIAGRFAIGCLILAVMPACHSPHDRSGMDQPPRVDEQAISAEPCMNPVVQFNTTLGSFQLTLDAAAAPVTVRNFIDYVQAGFYDGTVFHRVIASTMIQGGAFTPNMERKTDGLRNPIINEWQSGLKNKQWTIGIVRRPGVVDSAQAEFYINLVDYPALDMPNDGSGYCTFGTVTGGFDTIERIRNTPVGTHPSYADGRSAVVPQTPVVIKSARVLVPLDLDGVIRRAHEMEELRSHGVARIIEKYEAQSGHKAVRSDSGLVYIDLVVGRGGVPDESSNINVYYRGYFVNGQEFENHMQTLALLQMPKLVPGMKEGILSMAEGGRRAIIVPPDLAYGSGGIPGKIPPYATLIFEIELVEIK